MVNRKLAIVAVVAAAGLAFAPAARADLASFGWINLDGHFDAGTGNLTIVDSTGGGGHNISAGNVSRNVATVGLAGFNWSSGFIDMASVLLDIDVTNITDTTADGSGTFMFVDVDGDTTFFGTIVGVFTIDDEGSADFGGVISGADFGGGDGTFLGSDGGSFSTTFAETPPYTGSIISLNFEDWFTDGAGTVEDFEHSISSSSGNVVPAPGAALLGMIGFGAVGWIKRRFA